MPIRPPVHRPAFAVAPPSGRDRHGEPGSPSRLGRYDRTWQKLRAAFLAANPLCLFCQREGRVTAANEVDHIETIEDRPDLRLVWSNLRSLCKTHHSRRTATDMHRGRR